MDRSRRLQQVLSTCGLVGISFLRPVGVEFVGLAPASGMSQPAAINLRRDSQAALKLPGAPVMPGSDNLRLKPVLGKEPQHQWLAKQRSTLDAIWAILFPPPRKGAERGGQCIFQSDQVKDSLQTWSDHPLLVWEGTPKRIELHSNIKNALIWSHDVVESEQRSIQYDGEIPLERGQAYTYRVQYGEDDWNPPVLFQVMDEDTSQQIQRELSHKDLNPLSMDGASDAIILERAYYLAKRQLFMDTVRELFAWAERSPHHQSELNEHKTCILSLLAPND